MRYLTLVLWLCSVENDKAAEGQPAGSTGASRDGSPEGDRPSRVFHGPRNLDATAIKYMCPFKEAEEMDGNAKCPRMQHSVSHVSTSAALISKAAYCLIAHSPCRTSCLCMHTWSCEFGPGGKQILLLKGPASKQEVCINLAGASLAPEDVSDCCCASASDLV